MRIVARSVRLVATVLALGAPACTDLRLPLETKAPLPSTVLVTNATCATGPCQAVHVRLFPDAQFTIPAGLWSIELGVVSGASACLAIPAMTQFHITDSGTGSTTTYTWTSTDGAALGAITGSASALQAVPSTAGFVAGSAEGWQATLPGGTVASPAGTCTP